MASSSSSLSCFSTSSSDRQAKQFHVVGLVSGGKDSCHNLLHCVAAGHHVVALAHLRPANPGEHDSYMYQTVGQEVIDKLAECMRLPLVARTIVGTSLDTGRTYTKQAGDEVEDLYELLLDVKSKYPEIDAVSVGAILSDYQRVRVEYTCARLGLTVLAFLWQRNQASLLDEMIALGTEAKLIKVAAMGLSPKLHLGKSLAEMRAILHKLAQQYEVHVCGEGGEYESITVDSPLFHSKLCIDEFRDVEHSKDAFAPVGYRLITACHLEPKQDYPKNESHSELVSRIRSLFATHLPISPNYHVQTLTASADSHVSIWDKSPPRFEHGRLFLPALDPLENPVSAPLTSCEMPLFSPNDCPSDQPVPAYTVSESDLLVSVSNLVLRIQDGEATTLSLFSMLEEILREKGLLLSQVAHINFYLSRMDLFASANAAFLKTFPCNPPSRACIALPVGQDAIRLDIVASKESIAHLHVQSLSYWAPSNIGPYSQIAETRNLLFLSGQIGLLPPFMTLPSSLHSEAETALWNVSNLLLVRGLTLLNALSLTCFLKDFRLKDWVLDMFSRFCEMLELDEEVVSSLRSQIIFVLVLQLPRNANIEWQVIANKHKCSLRSIVAPFSSSIIDSKSFQVHYAVCKEFAFFVCEVSSLAIKTNPASFFPFVFSLLASLASSLSEQGSLGEDEPIKARLQYVTCYIDHVDNASSDMRGVITEAASTLLPSMNAKILLNFIPVVSSHSLQLTGCYSLSP